MMIALGAVLWSAAVLGLLAVGLAAAVIASYRRRHHGTAAPDAAPGPASSQSVVRPVATRPNAVRMHMELLFAEAKGTSIVIDALADVADGRGGVFGVPVCLILSRPDSAAAERLLFELFDEARADRWPVELDLTGERVSVKLRPPGREMTLPVAAASGLPEPS